MEGWEKMSDTTKQIYEVVDTGNEDGENQVAFGSI